MNKLFIDTCTNQLSIVVKKDNDIVYNKVFENKNKVAEILIKEVQIASNKCGFEFKDFNKLYITKGPGSYTGERLALCFGKIYALINQDAKVNIISTLKALALNKKDVTYICLLDARNLACFCGLYKNGEELINEVRLDKEDVISLINKYKDSVVVTTSSLKDEISSRYNCDVVGVDIAYNMALNEDMFEKDVDPLTIKPVYLRGKNEY